MDKEMEEPAALLQYVPFSSAIDAGFWHSFCDVKLNVLKLSENPIPASGSYTNTDAPGLPPRLHIEYNALKGSERAASSRWSCHANGTLINTNTIEEFRNRNKQDLLKECAADVWEAITSDTALDNPSLLASFLMFTFADLKKYHFYFWFAFPAFTYPKAVYRKPPQPITDVFTDEEMTSLLKSYTSELDDGVDRGFFTVVKHNNQCSIRPLRKYPHLREDPDNCDKEVYLAISDPSTLPSNPGWTLRNLLTLAAVKWSKKWQSYKVICLRVRTRSGVQDASHSLVIDVGLGDTAEDSLQMPPVLGWEKNERGKMGPRMINLSANMDPTKLAESAVDLNLKLMRWRVAPQLDLSVVQKCKCLLLGAGTLGCSVARCLMGWGVRHITLVDSGKVSYSNPVRQNLFTFKDCQDGGRHKAVAAAEALLQIFPKMKCEGVVLNIPMPGHTVGESVLRQVKEDVETLERLIDTHDAVFLLMDSRESRWLPTVIGAAKQKLVLTAALGFDSFLVMRHGMRDVTTDRSTSSPTPIPRESIPGGMLGCYYCNDVVAPGNSTQDRTLDQQCTVTRPGMSYLAAGYVTELLASILQHPDKGYAEASVKEGVTVKEGVLGPVPHSVRGFVGRLQQLTPATSAFDQCSGCSGKVLRAYLDEGFGFLLKVFNSTAYLEELSGLSKIDQCVDDSQVWELSDDEEIE